MAITVPYTYLIGWPEHQKYYYGVRYAKGCNPTELWITYFTSSRHVKEFAKLNEAPTIIEVRNIFTTASAARSWESRVLKRMKVVKKQEWLNKTDNKSIEPKYGSDNSSTRNDVRYKRSKSVKQWYKQNPSSRLGTVTPAEVKIKQSKIKIAELNPFYGKQHTEENKNLFSSRQTGITNSFYGKNHSDETKQKMSASQKGKIKPTSQCPHCKKIGGVNTMPRWHFDNCKELNND